MPISRWVRRFVLSLGVIASLLSLALLAVTTSNDMPDVPGERAYQADEQESRRVAYARADVVSEEPGSGGTEHRRGLGRERLGNGSGVPAGRLTATREMPYAGEAKSRREVLENDEAKSEDNLGKNMLFELNRHVADKLEECYDSWSSWADDARGTLVMNITYCPLPDGAEGYTFLTASVVEASFINQFFRSCVENSVRTILVPDDQGIHEQYCASEALTTRSSFRFGHHVPEEGAGDSSDVSIGDGLVPEQRTDDEQKKYIDVPPDARTHTGVRSLMNR